jgi:hypothetical protein
VTEKMNESFFSGLIHGFSDNEEKYAIRLFDSLV